MAAIMFNSDARGTIQMREKFDQTALFYILEHWTEMSKHITLCHFTESEADTVDHQTLNVVCQKYLQRSRQGVITVTYNQKKQRGRYFANGAVSLQAISREIRHTISRDHYVDIDIVNAHPNFLQWVCKRHNWECPELTDYIEKRDQIFAELHENYSIPKSQAKKIFLALVNGGLSDYNAIGQRKPAILAAFKEEMQEIRNKLKETYKTEWAAHEKECKESGREFNKEGSFLNHILCNIENSVLLCMWDHLKRPDDVVLCFDGMMVDKERKIDLSDLERAVMEKLNIPIKLAIKPMDQHLKIPANIPKHVELLHECYESYKQLIGRELSLEQAIDFIKQNIFEIMDGGKTYYITRSRVYDDEVGQYRHTYVKDHQFDSLKKNLHVRVNVINPEYNPYLADVIKNKTEIKKDPRYEMYLFDYLDQVLVHCIENGLIESFDRLVWKPCGSRDFAQYTADHHEFNTFTGFAVHYYKPVKQIDWTTTKFHRHLKTQWFKNNECELNHFYNWIAHGFQYVTERPSTGFLFHSEQGTGKSMFADLLDRICGRGFVVSILDQEQYFRSAFNAEFKDCIWKVFEELKSKGAAYSNKDRLKGEMTSKRSLVNQKYKDVVEVPVYWRYLCFSNNPNSIFLEPSDRRFSVIEIDNTHANDKEYFDPICNELADMDVVYSFWDFLMKWPVDKQQVHKTIVNQEKKRVIASNLNQCVHFMFDMKAYYNELIKPKYFEEGKIHKGEWNSIIDRWITTNKAEINIAGLRKQLENCGFVEKRTKDYRYIPITQEDIAKFCAKYEKFIDGEDQIDSSSVTSEDNLVDSMPKEIAVNDQVSNVLAMLEKPARKPRVVRPKAAVGVDVVV